MDANLLKLRLAPPAINLLEEKGIKEFADLVESQEALCSLRALVNPIQQSKLNALIKDFESAQDEADCNNGDKILLDSELKATRQEILSQIELERQCLEEINNLILEESAAMTQGAKQIVQKSKAVHQARATRLSIILRSRPVCDSAESMEEGSHQTQSPRAVRKLKQTVKFKKEPRPKQGRFTFIATYGEFLRIICCTGPKKAIYNSPRAREGVSNIFSGVSVFNAFSVAKDVVTDFIGSVTSGGKPPHDEPEITRPTRVPNVRPDNTCDLPPAKRRVEETHSAKILNGSSYNTRSTLQSGLTSNAESLLAEPLSSSFFNTRSDVPNSRPEMAFTSEDSHHSSPYNTRSTGSTAQLRPKIDLPPRQQSSAQMQSCLAQTESEDNNSLDTVETRMDDSDYVSVSAVDQMDLQGITRAWRENLLWRLCDLCIHVAQCNSESARLHHQRRLWVQQNAAFDMQVMMPYYRMSTQEICHEISQLCAMDRDLREREKRRHGATVEVRDTVQRWNAEAERLNLSLVQNPELDQLNWLEVVIVLKDQGDFMTVVMKHTGRRLVALGEFQAPNLYRIREAQCNHG